MVIAMNRIKCIGGVLDGLFQLAPSGMVPGTKKHFFYKDEKHLYRLEVIDLNNHHYLVLILNELTDQEALSRLITNYGAPINDGRRQTN